MRPAIELLCYTYPTWRPRIRAASSRRPWMDDSPEAFAYRCLPLNIANSHGWEILNPCGFDAEWTGGMAVEDVVVRPDSPSAKEAAVPLFGQGVLTFHVSGLFRTPPGYGLWVGGPPNAAKDAIAPLSGVIETDWSPYTFTMNWRFTRPRQPIRFEENEPFCFIFPVERGWIDAVRPQVAAIDDAPDLKRQYEKWSASRDRFRTEVEKNPPRTPAEKWQKLYYRGEDADGRPGTTDHRTKVRLPEFEGAPPIPTAFAASAAPARCPAAQAAPPADDGPGAAKLEWLLGSLEQLRALSGDPAIPRRRDLSTEAFRDLHYAANRPVLMEGAVADWPAVARWTPEHLKAAVGSAPVQVQLNRSADPDFERRMVEHAGTLPFDAFIDRICRPDAGNDAYMTAYNSARNREALAPLHAELGFLDAYLDRSGDHPHGMMWIGPKGTFTPLHHDLTNNLLLQITGRKVLLMVSPGETPKLYNDHHVYSRIRDLTEPGIVARFPKLNGVRVHRIVLQPGDALFVPLGWWHQVHALDFSVTITHTNFRWPNRAYETYPPASADAPD